MHRLALVIVFGLAFLAVVHLTVALEQDRLLAMSGGDARVLAEHLFKKDSALPCAMLSASRPDDLDILMHAITIVERFAVSGIKWLVEGAIVRGLTGLRLPAPDWSIGEAQIRISTGESAVRALGSPPRGEEFDRGALALRLLDRCENHRIGVLALRHMARDQDLDVGRLNRATILTLAAIYNGQRPSVGLRERAAKQMYQEVVYHLFHAIRLAV